jgi:hypothetical protein
VQKTFIVVFVNCLCRGILGEWQNTLCW